MRRQAAVVFALSVLVIAAVFSSLAAACSKPGQPGNAAGPAHQEPGSPYKHGLINDLAKGVRPAKGLGESVVRTVKTVDFGPTAGSGEKQPLAGNATDLCVYVLMQGGSSAVELPSQPDVDQGGCLVKDSAGKLWAPYERWDAGKWWIVLAFSADGGISWDDTKRIPDMRQPWMSVSKNQTTGVDWYFLTGKDTIHSTYLHMMKSSAPTGDWTDVYFDRKVFCVDLSYPRIAAMWNSTSQFVVVHSGRMINGNGMALSELYWNDFDASANGAHWNGQTFSPDTNTMLTDLVLLDGPASEPIYFIYGVQYYNFTSNNWDAVINWGNVYLPFNKYGAAGWGLDAENSISPTVSAIGSTMYMAVTTNKNGNWDIRAICSQNMGVDWTKVDIWVAQTSGDETNPHIVVSPTDPTHAQMIYNMNGNIYHKVSIDNCTSWNPSTWPDALNDASGKASSAYQTSWMLLDNSEKATVVWTDSRKTSAGMPSVVSTLPADGSGNADIRKNLSIQFNKAMDPMTVQFAITPPVGGGLGPYWTEGDSCVSLSHGPNLLYDTDYTVQVTDGKDILGNALSPLPFSFTFRTEVQGAVLAFTQPDASSLWQIGTTQDVVFTITGGTAPYRYWLNCSNDNGLNYMPIAAAQDVTSAINGSVLFKWNPVNPPQGYSYQSKLKVETTDANGKKSYAMSQTFGITPGTVTGPSVTVSGPKSQDVWYAGDTYGINWTITGGTAPYSVWLNYSTDGGTAWAACLASPPMSQPSPGANSYGWEVPSISPSANCKVSVHVVGGGRAAATSAQFSIARHGGILPPEVTATRPKSGDIWYINDTYAINWTVSEGLAPYTVWANYSTDGGSSYSAVPGAQGISQSSSSGVAYWTIDAAVPVSTACVVQVEVVGGGKDTATSGTFQTKRRAAVVPPSVAVTGPKAGDIWYAGYSYGINFTVSGSAAQFTAFINYSANNGATYNAVTGATGIAAAAGANTHLWTIPTVESAACIVSVEAVGLGTGKATDASDIFTIARNPNAPQAPANLRATAGNALVTLAWDEVAGADSYNVFRSAYASTGYIAIGTSAVNSYTDSNLTNGKTYYYKVRAVKGALESPYSIEASATPAAPGGGTGGGDSTMLYAGIGGVVAVVFIIVLLALLARKKKPRDPGPKLFPQPGDAAWSQGGYGQAQQPYGPQGQYPQQGQYGAPPAQPGQYPPQQYPPQYPQGQPQYPQQQAPYGAPPGYQGQR